MCDTFALGKKEGTVAGTDHVLSVDISERRCPSVSYLSNLHSCLVIILSHWSKLCWTSISHLDYFTHWLCPISRQYQLSRYQEAAAAQELPGYCWLTFLHNFWPWSNIQLCSWECLICGYSFGDLRRSIATVAVLCFFRVSLDFGQNLWIKNQFQILWIRFLTTM